MELAAVVVVPEKEFLVMPQETQADVAVNGASGSQYSSLLPILGNDVLHTWSQRIRKLGVQSFWLTSDARDQNHIYPAVDDFVDHGIERLLMIKLKSYAEMDLEDLIRFHCESRSSITEARDARGYLGVSVLDRSALRGSRERALPFHVPTAGQRRTYPFSGYAKRILSPRERQELVGDALTGACAMRPSGNEIRQQVWIGKDVRIASSARIIGPTFIGDRTVIREGATVGPFASVECDCVIDSGCTVERSTLLPGTYLAPGLLIQDALVDGGSLQHLTCGVVADLQAGGLACRIPTRQSRPVTSGERENSIVSRIDSSWSFEKWHEMAL